MSPASGDKRRIHKREVKLCLVSIQLMSPASGDVPEFTIDGVDIIVSIQLMSPASGDYSDRPDSIELKLVIVSIQLMSPASGDQSNTVVVTPAHGCFHSINVPSEWGPKQLCEEFVPCKFPFN